MRNLRLLRTGGCRPAAAPYSPQCFCLGVDPGTVFVGSQSGLLELDSAAQSVRRLSGPGSLLGAAPCSVWRRAGRGISAPVGLLTGFLGCLDSVVFAICGKYCAKHTCS